jgi:F1F0 ATPase subunit 2
VNTPLSIGLGTVAGAALGVFFFVGLWFTVRQGVVSRAPALWFMVSLLFRTAVVLCGLYAVGRDDWRRMLAFLVGFWIVRGVVVRLTRRPFRTAVSP